MYKIHSETKECNEWKVRYCTFSKWLEDGVYLVDGGVIAAKQLSKRVPEGSGPAAKRSSISRRVGKVAPSSTTKWSRIFLERDSFMGGCRMSKRWFKGVKGGPGRKAVEYEGSKVMERC